MPVSKLYHAVVWGRFREFLEVVRRSFLPPASELSGQRIEVPDAFRQNVDGAPYMRTKEVDDVSGMRLGVFDSVVEQSLDDCVSILVSALDKDNGYRARMFEVTLARTSRLSAM